MNFKCKLVFLWFLCVWLQNIYNFFLELTSTFNKCQNRYFSFISSALFWRRNSRRVCHLICTNFCSIPSQTWLFLGCIYTQYQLKGHTFFLFFFRLNSSFGDSLILSLGRPTKGGTRWERKAEMKRRRKKVTEKADESSYERKKAQTKFKCDK